MNKRGLQLALNTIVIIVLSILILISILVIWNYQTGIFSNFFKNIQGESNVDSIVTACNTHAAQQGFYEYCCVERDVKTKDEDFKLTCLEVREKSFMQGRINNLDCKNTQC